MGTNHTPLTVPRARLPTKDTPGIVTPPDRAFGVWGLSTLAATNPRTAVRVTGWAAVSGVAGGLLGRISRTRQALDMLG